ncbi:hypothetical protein C8D77_113131 [Mesorhizobium loti]|uniref:Uncharacterized protein n=1 Tax=Rhizobium loti TaxID=381 RepID=A0A8E2W7N3_RHILI|nr:hypothetical protein C8D77_113131 [Mesorhizobium loti]
MSQTSKRPKRLDFLAVIAGSAHPQSVYGLVRGAAEPNNEKRRKFSAEMFDWTAFPVRKEDRLILVSYGIAGAFSRYRQSGNR